MVSFFCCFFFKPSQLEKQLLKKKITLLVGVLLGSTKILQNKAQKAWFLIFCKLSHLKSSQEWATEWNMKEQVQKKGEQDWQILPGAKRIKRFFFPHHDKQSLASFHEAWSWLLLSEETSSVQKEPNGAMKLQEASLVRMRSRPQLKWLTTWWSLTVC